MSRGHSCEPRQRLYKELCNRSSSFSTPSSPSSPILSPASAFEDYWEDASVCLKPPTTHGGGGGAANGAAAVSDPCIKQRPTMNFGSGFYNKYESDYHGSAASAWLNRRRSFPPPVTSCVTRSIKEGGRFVLKEMDNGDTGPAGFFRAERENGRLRLRLVQHKENHEDDDPQFSKTETVIHEDDHAQLPERETVSGYGSSSAEATVSENSSDDDDSKDLTLTLTLDDDCCCSTDDSIPDQGGDFNEINEQGEVSEYCSSVSISSYGELADGHSYTGRSSNIMQVNDVDGDGYSSSTSSHLGRPLILHFDRPSSSSITTMSSTPPSSSSSLEQEQGVVVDPPLDQNPNFVIDGNKSSIENHTIFAHATTPSTDSCGNMALRSLDDGIDVDDGSFCGRSGDPNENSHGNVGNLDNPTTPCYPKHLYLPAFRLARISPSLGLAIG